MSDEATKRALEQCLSELDGSAERERRREVAVLRVINQYLVNKIERIVLICGVFPESVELKAIKEVALEQLPKEV